MDTEYYQRQIRGHEPGANLAASFSSSRQGAARVRPDWSNGTRVDRHGLWVKPARILGATTRTFERSWSAVNRSTCAVKASVLSLGWFTARPTPPWIPKLWSTWTPTASSVAGARRCLVLLGRGLVRLKHRLTSCCTCCCSRTDGSPNKEY